MVATCVADKGRLNEHGADENQWQPLKDNNEAPLVLYLCEFH